MWICLALFGASNSVFGQINVTNNGVAAQLVGKFVGTNVVYLNPTLNCPTNHSGEFEVINSNLPIGKGIVLSTGAVKSDAANGIVGVDGPVSDFSNFSLENGNSDPDLDTIINTDFSNNNNQDACVLEFDFVPDVDTVSTLRFKYVFASEEYPEYACSNFNDVFAFLLTGPGYYKNNVALVPGTTIPVAINSINMAPTGTGFPISTCNAMGPSSPFSVYYIDNQGANGTTCTMDGFTVQLEATAIVHPCDTYHMKLAIQDVGDGAFNSAVFLQENSFIVDTVTLDMSGIIQSSNGYLVEGCTPAVIQAVRTQPSPQKKKICLGYGGSAIAGLDYPVLPDTLVIAPYATTASMTLFPLQDNIDEPGFETVTIYRLNCCSKEPVDSISIQVRDSLKMELLSNDTSICGGSGVVTLHASGDPLFNYSWDPTTDVVNPNDSLTTATPTTTTTYTVTATYQGCPPVSRSFTASVEPIPIVKINPNDTAFCLSDPYPILVNLQPASFPNYNYQWSPTQYLDDPTKLQPEFFTRIPGDYKYMLTVTTPIGCTGSDTVHITARPAPELINVSHDTVARYGDKVQLNVEGATYYTWTPTRLLDYPNEPNPTAHAIDTATFQIIGTDQYGCRDTAYVHLGIDYTMFEYVPNAFSPNGDGRNDVFSIKHMHFQKLIEFRIFNRWGQEVYSAIDPNKGWDGTYQGVPQEIGVYQYLIRIVTPEGKQRTYKGDVSLIR